MQAKACKNVNYIENNVNCKKNAFHFGNQCHNIILNKINKHVTFHLSSATVLVFWFESKKYNDPEGKSDLTGVEGNRRQ